MIYPISGQTGIISKFEVYGLMGNLPVQGLLELDLAEVQHHVSKMQSLLDPSGLHLSLYDLQEKMVSCLLSKGLLI